MLNRYVSYYLAATFLLIATVSVDAADPKASPAEGYTIHVLAPHQMEDGTIGGPFHHYCKPVMEGKVFQCLLFKSADSNAHLVGVEYFVSKELARKHVPLIQWNRHFHDHEIEIAGGRVQVLDVSPDEAKKIAETAKGTDGVIFELWQEGDPIPNGKVTFPTAIGHVFRTK
jgi:hypothetical protein